MKIFIDAGHGGIDSGAVYGTRLEKDDNLKMAIAVGDRLFSAGFKVEYSRTDDRFVSLQERVRLANDSKADLFLSFHRNAYIRPSANGVEFWICAGSPRNTIEWANTIYSSVVSTYAQTQRGIKTGGLYVCKNTIMPAVLLEIGFITNDADNQIFEHYFSSYADAIASSVSLKFGLSERKTTYEVKLGKFNTLEEAKSILEKIQKAGLTGEIKESEKVVNNG